MATGCFGCVGQSKNDTVYDILLPVSSSTTSCNSMPTALNDKTPNRIFCIKYTVFVANMVLRFQMFWNSRHSATDTTCRCS